MMFLGVAMVLLCWIILGTSFLIGILVSRLVDWAVEKGYI